MSGGRVWRAIVKGTNSRVAERAFRDGLEER